MKHRKLYFWLALSILFYWVNMSRNCLWLEREICASIWQGGSWGRQMLIGSSHCQPLANLFLLILTPLGKIPHFRPEILYAAICQASFCLYFGRFLHRLRPRLVYAVCIPIIALLFCPIIMDFFAIALLAYAFYHFQCGKAVFATTGKRSLRDDVSVAVACGGLVLCGGIWLLLGIGLAVSLSINSRKNPVPCGKMLSLLPICWCLVLLLLWNWLILQDPLYRLKDDLSELSSPTQRNLEKFIAGKPTPELLPQDRLILCGNSLPVLFRATTNPQCITLLECQEVEIRKLWNQGERVYLLLPPPELHLFSANSTATTVYNQGAKWLLLERQVPDTLGTGKPWRLFRVL